MLKYERLELPEAIDKYLSMRQNDNAKSIRRSVRRKKRKDLTIGERIAALFDLHYYKARAIDMAELIRSYREFNSPDRVYHMPLDLKKEIEYVVANMSISESNQVQEGFNQAISRFYMSSKMDVISRVGKLRRVLKKTKQEGTYMTYWKNGKPINTTLSAGIEQLYDGKITTLESTRSSSFVKMNIHGIPKEETPVTEAETYLENIEEMLRKGEIRESDITRNVEQIRTTFKERRELEQLNSKIWSVICGLKKEAESAGIDFSKTIRILQTIYGRNRKRMDSYDNYLAQFDFVSLGEKIEWVKDKRKQEALTRERLEAIDQVSQITPRDPEVTAKIKKNIHTTMSAKNELWEMAVNSLRVNGELEQDHFHVGNLVFYTPEDSENQKILIHEKISEMISIASKTPEERAIDYLKGMGMVPETSTVSDLSEKQLESYQHAFRDDAYDFDIERIRQIKALIDSQRQEKATTIFKEYIKYRAKLKDKTKAVSFSEYARVVYLQENMDLSMVSDEEISMDSSMVFEQPQSKKR